MKVRILSVLVVALALSVSIAFAGEKDQKNAKSPAKKKATMGCCSHESAEKKDCTELEMKECEEKGEKSSTKASGTKVETKKVETPETKKK